MEPIPYEARLVTAVEAIKNSEKLSIRAAAKIYNVPRITVQTRVYGVLAQRDIPPKSLKLTELEEQAIIQYTLDLITRAFPPRLCNVEDMANDLLRVRNASPVGKN